MARTAKKTNGRRQSKSSKAPSLAWILGGLAVVALIAVVIVANVVNAGSRPGERFASQGNVHVQLGQDHPAYNSDPPTSGWHTPDLAPWGSYDYLVPEERLIHNMEDGGVILWYRFGTPEENRERITALEEVARGYNRVVIAPREAMPTTYALTAWQRLQRFDAVDREGMRAFLEAYEGIDHHAR